MTSLLSRYASTLRCAMQLCTVNDCDTDTDAEYYHMTIDFSCLMAKENRDHRHKRSYSAAISLCFADQCQNKRLVADSYLKSGKGWFQKHKKKIKQKIKQLRSRFFSCSAISTIEILYKKTIGQKCVQGTAVAMMFRRFGVLPLLPGITRWKNSRLNNMIHMMFWFWNVAEKCVLIYKNILCM